MPRFLDISAFNNLTYDRFSKVLRTNLDSVLICTVAAARFLAKSPCARILNIASIMGMRGSRDSVPYSTAKGGVVNMTGRSPATSRTRASTLTPSRPASSTRAWRACPTAATSTKPTGLRTST